jgi:hypothetical protein
LTNLVQSYTVTERVGRVFPEPQDIVGTWHGWIVHPIKPQRLLVKITYDGLFQFQGTYSFPDHDANDGSFTALLGGIFLYIELPPKDSYGPLHFHLNILIGENHKMMYGAIPPSDKWPPRVPFATVTMFPGEFPAKIPVAAWQEFFTELK